MWKSVVSRPRPLSFDAFGSLVAKRMPSAGRPEASAMKRILVATTKSEISDVRLPVEVTSEASGAFGLRMSMFNRS